MALDGLFAESYGRWGGRYSLVIPCVAGRVPAGYWPWLEAYDADIVYSYVALGDTDQLEIHERLGPSLFQQHEHHGEPRLDVHGFKPSYGSAPLSSLSTIFRLARHRRGESADAPLEILDCWSTDEVTRAFADNFGTYHASCGTSVFPPDARGAARLLTIVSPEKQQGRFGVPRDLTTVPSEQAAFEAFADGRATSMSLASMSFASRLDMRLHGWGSSFQLVVGDEFSDRVMFWNGRLLIPAWLKSDLCCLRVSPAQLEDQAFFDALVQLLNRYNHVNDGSGGQTSLTIRSTSVTAEGLERIASRIRVARCWSVIRVQFVGSLDEMLPTRRDIEHASLSHRLGDSFTFRPDWSEFGWEAPTVQPPSSAPDHLSDAPPRQHFTTGAWATDFSLDHEDPSPRAASANRWILPRRWRMAGAFTAEFSRSGGELRFVSRTSRKGDLTVYEAVDRHVRSITIPTAWEAIRHALVQDGNRVRYSSAMMRAPLPPSKASWMAPSNEARYLGGVVGMCGGLGPAQAFLLHPFILDLMARLGGTPSLPADKVAPTLNRLKKASQNVKSFDLTDPDERLALATLILKAAQNLKSPQAFARHSDIRSDWDNHREAFWERQGSKPEGDPDVDWEARERQSLDECLVRMRNRQMLFQGHRWLCDECHHRNWVDLSELRGTLVCSICHGAVDAPIDVEWLFRPNEFLIEGLRDHSVLSLLWVLAAFQNRAQASLIYGASTRFWFEKAEGGPDAEADLLLVCDGRTFVVEVKSSWAGVRDSDIDALVALALRLRPDSALLAVMEDADGKSAKIEKARQTLTAEGIDLELMTLKSAPLDDDPYLP